MYQKMSQKFNNLAFIILVATCALTPLLFLSSKIAGFGAVKGMLFYSGVLLALSFWLISQFIEGSIKFPKSSIFSALFVWIALSLVSALTSANVGISLWGKGFSLDSFATNAVLAVFVFLLSVFSSEQKRLAKVFVTYFFASVSVVILQIVLYISQNFSFVSKYLSHVSNQGTLVGSWVDFSYFVTLTFILGLLVHEVLVPKGFFKKASLVATVLSLIVLIFLNFKTAWIVTAVASLVVFVYKTSVERFLVNKNSQNAFSEESHKSKFPLASFASLLVALFFFLGSSSIGTSISKWSGITFTNIKPSFETTNYVLRQSLYRDPILGSGAGSYQNVWDQYHKADINQTIFWNSSFDSGFSMFQSLLTTNGILPVLALVVVLLLALIQSFKLLNSDFPDQFSRFISVVSLVMTLLFVAMFFLAVPGFTLVVSGFMYLGILFGVSVLVGKTKLIYIDYLKDARTSFFTILLLVISSMLALSFVYFTGARFASIVSYNKALGSSDIASAEKYINKAISLSNNDDFWRARASLYVNEFNKIASGENPDKNMLQALFTQAEQSAQSAILLNKKSATNFLLLSQIYQLISSGEGNSEALEKAKSAGIEAQNKNPNNPVFVLNNARVALISKDNESAMANIEKAISLKRDYLEAYVLRGQIKSIANSDSSLVKNEVLEYIKQFPSSEQAHLVLASSYLEEKSYDKSIEYFQKAISINPSNANNYLLLVGAFESAGQKENAVELLKEFQKLFPRVDGVSEQIQRIESGKATQ